MNTFRTLSDQDVRNKIDMATAITLMRDAFVQISKRSANVPVRAALNSENATGRVLFMPAYSPSYNLFGLKMISVFPDNVKYRLPSIQGKMLIMDDKTGTPLGLIDAEYLTSLRTGAASGLATDLLAKVDAKILAIFGTGAQAKTQVDAILQVRSIKEVFVFGSSADKSKLFCEYLHDKYKITSTIGNITTDLLKADIICTATTSTYPLFTSGQVKPGVHINGIGSYKPEIREIPSTVIQQSLLIVDHRESALSEAGDIIIPIQEGLITSDNIHAELGELLEGKKHGRTNSKQITVFKSVGNALQDLALANFLLI